ncbi:MAG TPA: CotH kinase family protein [Candidatus Hydrogenedentes bacterium]|nr:CotH kinase family protein [Candidatus Hydrogenedentota bacterium]HPG69835.1 CotH kinase family protein [Candidatus Hydrogenedentota bacterium]
MRNAEMILNALLIGVLMALLAGCPTPPPEEEPVAPSAAFAVAPVAGYAPLRVQFADNSDPGTADITAWAWDFGDGGSSSDRNPTHTYTQPGTYRVALTVTTSVGSDTNTQANLITVEESVLLNELMAANTSGLEDEDGDDEDWIELYNPMDVAVSLAGWRLTDDPNVPEKWVFPEVTLAAKSYLIVFASDKDRRPTGGGELHTNFKFSGDGEYLALFNASGRKSSVDAFSPAFPVQLSDISYGRYGSDGEFRYFDTPTPGGPNIGGKAYIGIAQAPDFSSPHGFYDYPFNLTLTCKTTGATIRYTLDGSEPTKDAGTVYAGALRVNGNTAVRALAYHDEYFPSRVVTATYLVDVSDAEKSLPALCLVGDEHETLYEPNGVMAIVGGHYEPDKPGGIWYADGPDDYNNPTERGEDYERPASIEFLPVDKSAGFQINCGLRIHGGSLLRARTRRADDWSQPYTKFSFRFYFDEKYGADMLRYPLFEESKVERYKQLVLRGGHNDQYNPFITDELARRLFNDMGQVSSLGTMVNLYINGQYKSYFNLTERFHEDFLQEAFKSKKAWDVVSPSGATDGDTEALYALLGFIVTVDLSDDAMYDRIRALVRVKEFIDYIILETYIANWDWPNHNWVVAQERTSGGEWMAFVWDSEAAMNEGYVDANPFIEFPVTMWGVGFGLNGENAPIPWLYQGLSENAQFRELFAERVRKHFIEDDGALQNANIRARFDELRALMAGVLPDMDTYIPDVWIPQRRDIYLNLLVEQGLFSWEDDGEEGEEE